MDINKIILDKRLTHVKMMEAIYITMISFIYITFAMIDYQKFTVEISLINTHVN